MNDFLKSINEGAFVQGHNPDIDAAETIWNVGGQYPWASFGVNNTLSVASDSAEDDITKAGPVGTGAYTLLLEGLSLVTINEVTGYQIISEVINLTGAVPAVTTKQYSYLTRARVIAAGSGNANAGTITFTHNVTVISVMVIGHNRIEDAVFVVPNFNTGGQWIHGAYPRQIYAYMFVVSNAFVTGAVRFALPGTNIFSSLLEASITSDAPLNSVLTPTFMYPPGTKFEMSALSVSAANMNVFCGMHFSYQT